MKPEKSEEEHQQHQGHRGTTHATQEKREQHEGGSKARRGKGQEGAESRGRTKGQVDLNEASVEELEKISGVGRERARLLIEHRPFKSWEDVEN